MMSTKETPGRGGPRVPESLTGDKRQSSRFLCHACGWIYVSPIPVSRVSHRCPARGYDRRVLREVGE